MFASETSIVADRKRISKIARASSSRQRDLHQAAPCVIYRDPKVIAEVLADTAAHALPDEIAFSAGYLDEKPVVKPIAKPEQRVADWLGTGPIKGYADAISEAAEV